MKPWLMEIIRKQLAILLSLSLRNAPAHDIIHMTAEAWYLALEASGQFYSQQRDAQRLLEAFKIILPKLKYWPAPSDILENLPKVEKVKQIEAEISPTSDELRQAQANWSLIYQVIEGKITQEEAIRTWEENAKPK